MSHANVRLWRDSRYMPYDRRPDFLRKSGLGQQGRAAKEHSMTAAKPTVKALVFDVFGTVVDWRTSIIAEAEAFGARKGITIDWAALVDQWRGGYQPSMQRVRSGELPWTKLDALHRVTLDRLLREFGIAGLSEAEIDWLNRAWHRLTPWPDAVAGLARLRRRFLIGTLSNGNVSLLAHMAKNA